MRFGLTFINYNNSAYTARLLESLRKVERIEPFHVVIVDNASRPPDREALVEMCRERDEVTLLLNEANVGYFRGLNLGIAHLRKTFPQVEYIVVGNNDLEFFPDLLSSIQAKSDLFQRHAVIAPDIIGPDGEHQNPHVISPIGWKRELVYDLYYSNYQVARLILFVNRVLAPFTRRKDHLSHDVGQEIHQGYGACYVLGPLFVRNYPELWAPTFLMGEEYFLAKQLAARRLTQYYEPSIRVFHCGHATTSSIPRREMWEIAKLSHKIYREHKPLF